ncbi:hypothetical protein Sjap_016015 [Stephania japonica]|uniref:Transcription factor MYC/MYB N-terminal domain-containing protein n=1 Tax=Stephania japonica TaxID=461633 RepID=A0AAP0NRX9_9MAGN
MEEKQCFNTRTTHLPLTHHLLQHTLRSLCMDSQWVYAVFWRILPRNYPPPKWEGGSSALERTRANRRNWILVWEDGFCNFDASSAVEIINPSYSHCEFQQFKGLQPELFFKMSHEIYNYGEGLIGKVSANHSHMWVYRETNDQATNLLSTWHNSADPQPRTWKAQFDSGIQTIALIGVGEGVIQLGAIHKVMEDPNFVVLLRKKFSYLGSIPGVLLPHPLSSPFSYKVDEYGEACNGYNTVDWPIHTNPSTATPSASSLQYTDQFNQIGNITPSMDSLEALLAKLPSVVPSSSPSSSSLSHQFLPSQGPLELIMKKEIMDNDIDYIGESSSSTTTHPMYSYHQYYYY